VTTAVLQVQRNRQLPVPWSI